MMRPTGGTNLQTSAVILACTRLTGSLGRCVVASALRLRPIALPLLLPSQGLFLYTWGDANNDYELYMAQREAGIGGLLVCWCWLGVARRGRLALICSLAAAAAIARNRRVLLFCNCTVSRRHHHGRRGEAGQGAQEAGLAVCHQAAAVARIGAGGHVQHVFGARRMLCRCALGWTCAVTVSTAALHAGGL